MELIIDITEHEWEYLNKLVENGDQLGHYERLLVNGHVLEQQSDDCVSRQAVDQRIYDYAESNGLSYANMKNYILDLPPVTPIHGTCKDCEHCGNKYTNNRIYCSWLGNNFEDNFYCADFKKRGNENDRQ